MDGRLGELHFAGQQYLSQGNDFWSGPIHEDLLLESDLCNAYDRLWKLNKTTIDSFRLGLLSNIPTDILEWPALGNPNFELPINENLAPFVDVNGDGLYNAFDGDYPQIKGDQSVWRVGNDLAGPHLATGGSNPIGVELRTEAYAFTESDLANYTFYHFQIANKSSYKYPEFYFSMWVDVELGQFDDDMLGCDTTQNMLIAYGADDFDNRYGENIPMLGIKFLQTPANSDGEEIGMSAAITPHPFNSGSSTLDNVTQFFSVMQGLWADGSPINYGDGSPLETEATTTFMHVGNPADSEQWSHCSYTDFSISDKRGLMTTGSFSFAPNEVHDIYLAVLWIRDSIPHPCPDFTPMLEAAEAVQQQFDEGIITHIATAPIPANFMATQVYPNPNRGAFTVTLANVLLNENEVKFELFDLLGNKIFTTDLLNKENNIVLPDFVPGLYVYKIHRNGKIINNGKLMLY